MAYYYRWAGGYGIYDIASEKRVKLPVYYGLKLFQMLASECIERVKVTADNEKVRVLAGKTTDGKTRLLVSCFEMRNADIEIAVDGVTEAMLYSVGANYEEEKAKNGRLLTSKTANSHSFTLRQMECICLNFKLFFCILTESSQQLL